MSAHAEFIMGQQWRMPPLAPPKPGIYRVLAYRERRWAKWTDQERAAKCDWKGPDNGYPWLPNELDHPHGPLPRPRTAG
jgi:hypothetical protein